MMNRVKSFDIFGEPVGVNYKGDTAFKTCGGALFTVVIYLIVLVFAGVKCQTLVMRMNPQVSTTEEFSNYSTD